jgi:hypothetical protein
VLIVWRVGVIILVEPAGAALITAGTSAPVLTMLWFACCALALKPIKPAAESKNSFFIKEKFGKYFRKSKDYATSDKFLWP